MRKEGDALSERREDLEAQIKSRIGEQDGIRLDDGSTVTWRRTKDREAHDYERLKLEHPEVLADYAVTLPGSRRFLAKFKD